MINFNQLRIFYETAKCLSCTVAAKKLYITQPAVTTQIRLFEDYCNLKLFKRKGRKIYLTDEGKTLFDYARRIFEYEKEIDNVIEEMRVLKRGVLRLGTTKTYARYFMPFIITSFHESYPHIKIHLDEGSSLEMIHSLLDLKDEIAVIAKAEDNPNIQFIPFSQEEIVVIVSPGRSLAKKKPVSLRRLIREPIIMKETGSGTRRLVSELFAKNGLTPEVLMETSNTEFIKQLVSRGEGVAFLVKETVALELQEGKLQTVPLKGQKLYLDVSIAYLKDQQLSPPAQAFLEILFRLKSGEKPDQGIRTMMARMLDQWK
jgi:DNA-binding transcriptional LysR family regulator